MTERYKEKNDLEKIKSSFNVKVTFESQKIKKLNLKVEIEKIELESDPEMNR